mgnify:FL=1
MNVVHKVELKIEKFDKCHMISDQDCPLGQIYDFACAFKTFICQKIQEHEAQQQSSKGPDISPEVEKAE